MATSEPIDAHIADAIAAHVGEDRSTIQALILRVRSISSRSRTRSAMTDAAAEAVVLRAGLAPHGPIGRIIAQACTSIIREHPDAIVSLVRTMDLSMGTDTSVDTSIAVAHLLILEAVRTLFHHIESDPDMARAIAHAGPPIDPGDANLLSHAIAQRLTRESHLPALLAHAVAQAAGPSES